MSELPPPMPLPPDTPPPPRGFVPYPGGPTGRTPMRTGQFRRVGSLARAMVILLAIWGALQVILLPMTVTVHGKAGDYLDGRISEASFKDAYNTMNSVQGLQGGVNIALVVLTMVWMYRLAQNHRLFGRPGSTWSPGWAIGGWFVPPGVVYAVPWLMFSELWRGSDPANHPDDPSWKQRPVSPLIHVWWVLYGFVPIIGLIAGLRIGFGSLSDFENSTRDVAKLYDRSFGVNLALGVVSIGTAAVYALIVAQLSSRQKALTGEA